ncbi:ROK family protein [Candidatus Enterococcus clewellii]|uniref:Fructokinase n=1 Tax=Candidatus Enterococcus clewellii TaxID=1834193 RepID=A0A242KE02_9ENTE|nr:ROK family protein [Enterococcus sp. 9E7_DIV0242]OTP19395.1 hypothetical protein A5888_001212 [Enterococcus sp. 9E7_DIV0242]
MYYGGIEAGGTKFVCAVSDGALSIIDQISIPTTTPIETLRQVTQFFDQYPLISLGVGSFGPIGIDPEKAEYGHILTTPKKGWTNTDLLGMLKEQYALPIGWTTDVNAAALGELKLGAAKEQNSCVYLTVGTGIGGGFVTNGQPFSGFSHPEMGHIHVKRHKEDTYAGGCPYHQDCLEGLAAGPSLKGRTGIEGTAISADHEIWAIQAYYIAQALMTYTLTFSPEVIVLGGGVMNQPHLLHQIRASFVEQMNSYVLTPPIEDYIVEWGLPNQSGIYGSLLLAKNAAKNTSE